MIILNRPERTQSTTYPAEPTGSTELRTGRCYVATVVAQARTDEGQREASRMIASATRTVRNTRTRAAVLRMTCLRIRSANRRRSPRGP